MPTNWTDKQEDWLIQPSNAPNSYSRGPDPRSLLHITETPARVEPGYSDSFLTQKGLFYTENHQIDYNRL